ncbi:hypothetical protein [Actinacidiphila glaucinigra]|uniref:Uncharacterized protein n=1 Tax=Actinacidiphila glaucinigra TaxID=235986 RepID=A0A239KLV7_9ACTN|nr:hypothetical protein [Actinacidiphila glaucinigra]SNT19045.1 hypothetical protein SAMN05216252_11637 [Actinacidiphila glaucinigra]
MPGDMGAASRPVRLARLAAIAPAASRIDGAGGIDAGAVARPGPAVFEVPAPQASLAL